ncbi:MAG: lipoyl(octanoyl) transferase LipB [Planctomycetota bacterium]|nr:lipoyl(octanoyl) transferase LipB [Planctomycetota bacterium]
MEKATPSTALPANVQIKILGEVPFTEVHHNMIELQQRLGTAPADTIDAAEDETLFLFEPSPVVTLGSGASSADLLIGKELLHARGIEIHQVDRGGEATYHGPGQLLAYPVLKLAAAERDLHRLLRTLESAVLETLEHWGIKGQRDRDHTGVWIQEHKIASIGLSVRRWVTGHGLALCVSGDLDPFDWIVPCGIHGCPVTSMERELGYPPEREEVEAVLAHRILEQFGRGIPR